MSIFAMQQTSFGSIGSPLTPSFSGSLFDNIYAAPATTMTTTEPTISLRKPRGSKGNGPSLATSPITSNSATSFGNIPQAATEPNCSQVAINHHHGDNGTTPIFNGSNVIDNSCTKVSPSHQFLPLEKPNYNSHGNDQYLSTTSDSPFSSSQAGSFSTPTPWPTNGWSLHPQQPSSTTSPVPPRVVSPLSIPVESPLQAPLASPEPVRRGPSAATFAAESSAPTLPTAFHAPPAVPPVASTATMLFAVTIAPAAATATGAMQSPSPVWFVESMATSVPPTALVDATCLSEWNQATNDTVSMEWESNDMVWESDAMEWDFLGYPLVVQELLQQGFALDRVLRVYHDQFGHHVGRLDRLVPLLDLNDLSDL